MFLLERKVISSFKDHNDLYNEVEELIKSYNNVLLCDILSSFMIRRYLFTQFRNIVLPRIGEVTTNVLKNLDLQKSTTSSIVKTYDSSFQIICTVVERVDKSQQKQIVLSFAEILKKKLIKLFGSKIMNYSTIIVKDHSDDCLIIIDMYSKITEALNNYEISQLPVLAKQLVHKLNSNLTNLTFNNTIISSKMNKASPEVSVKLIEPFKYKETKEAYIVLRTLQASIQFDELNGNSYKIIIDITIGPNGFDIDIDVCKANKSTKSSELYRILNELDHYDQYKDSTKLDNLIRSIAKILYPHWYK